MDQNILQRCSQDSFAGTMTFPQVVAHLKDAGVQRYHVDLIGLRKSHYGHNDTVADLPLPLTDAPVVAQAFSRETVQRALVAVQHGQIGYPEFLRQIIVGGTVAYTVYLDGRQTVYVGRHGDQYVEPFPAL